MTNRPRKLLKLSWPSSLNFLYKFYYPTANLDFKYLIVYLNVIVIYH